MCEGRTHPERRDEYQSCSQHNARTGWSRHTAVQSLLIRHGPTLPHPAVNVLGAGFDPADQRKRASEIRVEVVVIAGYSIRDNRHRRHLSVEPMVATQLAGLPRIGAVIGLALTDERVLFGVACAPRIDVPAVRFSPATRPDRVGIRCVAGGSVS